MKNAAPAYGIPIIDSQSKNSSDTKGTFGQILKSSAMVGGSQLSNIIISMVRTKVMALMLGPAGLGLFGMFSLIVNLTQTLAGLGINSSGVRQIAAASGSGDENHIALTLRVLRLCALASGVTGSLLLLVFSKRIAILTFTDDRQAHRIAWLSIAVFLTLLSASQTALIQGARRIADLAKMQVSGALCGTILGLPLVYVYKEQGIIPLLICVAATTSLSSWWYSRKVTLCSRQVETSNNGLRVLWGAVRDLIHLGVAFMISSLVTLGVSYSIRVIILHRLGLHATGVYQSAWTLGGMYVGFILQAMGADFYPRLTTSIQDNALCNRLVNEQALVGLLLAGPGVLASIALAPAVIVAFYGAKFEPAAGILRWICLGALLQVISFPMGYVIVAKAKQGIFIACECVWAVASIGFAWAFIYRYGLVGAGIASFASYLFHWVMLYAVVHKMNGFRWSSANIRAGALTLAFVAVTFAAVSLTPWQYGVGIGATVLLLSTLFSIRMLVSLFLPEQIPRRLRKVLIASGLIPQIKTVAIAAL